MSTGVETVVRLRPSGPAGRHGARAAEGESNIRNCTLIPLVSDEQGGDVATTTTAYTLVMPPGSDLKATDRVRARGLVWDVEGEPGDYRSKRGKRKAAIAVIRRVTG